MNNELYFGDIIYPVFPYKIDSYSYGFRQKCSNSIASTLELLQSCIEPLICTFISPTIQTLKFSSVIHWQPNITINNSWVKGSHIISVATFIHVGGSFNLFMATTRDVWIITSFRIMGYVLHVEHISCVITNCGQHQWVILSPLSKAV